jgi:hypothetical protein
MTPLISAIEEGLSLIHEATNHTMPERIKHHEHNWMNFFFYRTIVYLMSQLQFVWMPQRR